MKGYKRKTDRHYGTPLHPMPVRPASELKEICARCGGNPVMAALLGKLNAEEYLQLEKLNEH